jgi:hypothetical protein
MVTVGLSYGQALATDNEQLHLSMAIRMLRNTVKVSVNNKYICKD